MADWLFDGANRIIQEPAGSGDTSWNIERDIYSAWKRWAKTASTAHYPPAFTVEGGLPIGATGLFTGKTQILINGWKLKAASHAHQALLEGNIYSDDGVITVASDPGGGNIVVLQSANAQGIATGTPDLSGIESDINRLKIRLDVHPTIRNTYNDDNSQIANSEFTLANVDNANGTFTVTYIEN